VSLALSRASVRFRGRIIEALLRIDREGYWYIDRDTCAGTCPLCGGVLSVYFAGFAPRAEIVCRGGCDESQVVAGFGRSAQSR
jgi:hypothetical protein